MCNAFSCIIDQSEKITWKLGVDSHSALARLGGYQDRVLGEFAKIEITPKNNNYLFPDEWIYRVDESPVPRWCGMREKELCFGAHKKWLSALNKRLNPHSIVNPLLLPPPEVGSTEINLLKKWASVRDSVWASVWASVGDSVGDSVRDNVRDSVRDNVRDSVWASVEDSVRDNVWDSVWDSVRDNVRDSVRDNVRDSVWASVRDSVWAYTGSFFKISEWKNIKHPRGKYPYQPLVDLWNRGLMPSFDGKTWRLHSGPKAKIVYTITAEDLRTR